MKVREYANLTPKSTRLRPTPRGGNTRSAQSGGNRKTTSGKQAKDSYLLAGTKRVPHLTNQMKTRSRYNNTTTTTTTSTTEKPLPTKERANKRER